MNASRLPLAESTEELMYGPSAYRAAVMHVKSRVDSKDLVISMGDAFPPQMPLLKDGLGAY